MFWADLVISKEEETRLRDQHEMLKMIYNDWSNLLHPDFMGDPASILDCGFGSGNWACDIAEYDSDCRVSINVNAICEDFAYGSGDRRRHLSSDAASRSTRQYGTPGNKELFFSALAAIAKRHRRPLCSENIFCRSWTNTTPVPMKTFDLKKLTRFTDCQFK